VKAKHKLGIGRGTNLGFPERVPGANRSGAPVVGGLGLRFAQPPATLNPEVILRAVLVVRGLSKLLGLVVVFTCCTAAAECDDGTLAESLISSCGAPGGVCVVLGHEDADLAVGVCEQGEFVVHALYPERGLVDEVRRAVRSRGVYGKVSADVSGYDRLPYAENLVNVLIADDFPELSRRGLSIREVLRVLCPLGTAFFGVSGSAGGPDAKWVQTLRSDLLALGVGDGSELQAHGTWVKVVKPWPDDIDEWSHNCHGPDGNPVANDRVVGPPRHYQWVAAPLYLRSHDTDSSVNGLVTAGGRVFYIVDEAPISLPGDHPLPDKWSLVARDAFNGVLLWKVPIEQWGWREWKQTWFKRRPGNMPLNLHRRVVASAESVFATLGYRAPVSRLDAKTGSTLRTYEGTERTNEIIAYKGVLILSMNRDAGLKIVALQADTGETLWETGAVYSGTKNDFVMWPGSWGPEKVPKLDAVANLAVDGNAVCFLDGQDVVCLDFQTGRERWRSRVADEEDDLWVGTLIVHQSVVLHATRNRLVALSRDTGKELWSKPKRELGWLWFQWKEVFLVRGLVWTWSAELDEKTYQHGARKHRSRWPVSVNGYDLLTGELKKQISLGHIFTAHHHHRCYPDRATERYILASRRGTEFVDLQRGEHTVHNWVRGTCHLGMMPANGLQYVPPHPCACYINEKLNGFNALAPEGPASRREPNAETSPRIERGPALTQTDGAPADDEDWPTFRHDALRSGSTRTAVPRKLARCWSARAGEKLSPPVVADGKVFLAAVDEHHVLALGAEDGSMQWEFAAGGRVDSPPTYYRGTLLFGSADGWVYCLKASDGEQIWRFRAAPQPRRIGAFGQLESAWPVHGSVLVHGNVAYFAAGRSSYLDGGIDLYGVNAATGELLHHRHLEGPYTDFSDDEAHFHYGAGPGALTDILQADSQHLYMRNNVFDLKLESQKGGSLRVQANGGFLDDTYFKRAFWFFGKPSRWARLIVHDDRTYYGLRMFDRLKYLDPNEFFVPGDRGYLLFAQDIEQSRPKWAVRIPLRAKAMLLADRLLLVAGPPDVVDPDDPLGAFEGRKGGRLFVFSADSGEKIGEQGLDSPPVFNGMAAAQGRLYVAAANGEVLSFAAR